MQNKEMKSQPTTCYRCHNTVSTSKLRLSDHITVLLLL